MKTKNRTLTTLGLGVTALALAACSAASGPNGAESEYLEAVPELDALSLALTGDADAEGLATADDRVAVGGIADAFDEIELVEGTAADGIVLPVRAVRELNQALRNFLRPIAALVRDTEPDAVSRNVAEWGPVTRGDTEYRFFVRKGLLRRYGWLLQARPQGSDREYVNVAAGSIDVGERVRRGRGTIGVDLDALAGVDATVTARGEILGAFAHRPAGTALSYRLRDFTRDADDATPIDAAFQGARLVGGDHRVRLAFHGDLPETASEAEELVLARVRQRRGEGGRADWLVQGGDVAEGRVWVVSECWDAGFTSVYRVVRDCPGDGIGGERCVVQSSAGEASACLEALRAAELPPSDPEAPMADAESPDADLSVPDAMPSGEAP